MTKGPLLRDVLAAPDLVGKVNAAWLEKNRRLNFTANRKSGFVMPERLSLGDLEASFVKFWSKGGRQGWRNITGRNPMTHADGITFLCPLCFRNNGGAIGTHIVICWFAHVPLKDPKTGRDISPLPGRWHVSGSGLEDLSFVGPGAASVLLLGGCNWHGFIRNGYIVPA